MNYTVIINLLQIIIINISCNFGLWSILLFVNIEITN